MTPVQPDKRVTLIEKRRDMTDAAFHAHWSGPHAEIARDLPGLVWYVQNHVRRVLWTSPGQSAPYLGIAEIAFDTPGAIFDRIDGWARVDELREDEGRFLSARYGCWTHAGDLAIPPAQRRIVVQVNRPATEDQAARGRLASLAERIGATLPCHVEDCVGPPADDLGDPPGAFLFIELPERGDIDQTLTLLLDGLADLHARGVSATAYLVHAEAKRLPIDLAIPTG
ncbi:EthD domain-containing protein [Palleronia abyssalis]|uniref:EthD domain-containing protein n=1 Tax=Palleronia abyssalis TaxID=1501240 RepID=A0A2R8BZ36_9RHOB|nr:EthD domain-containing protein [Palleronia abyssalis]SPJ25399.1 hypothetical protein PAA8504_03250 [Palleronia abyssalis]